MYIINIGHSHIQKHVSYKKLCKNYKYYAYRLTMKFSDALLRKFFYRGKFLKNILTYSAYKNFKDSTFYCEY